MGNYTPNSFMIQPIYDPTRPFATPNFGSTWLYMEEENVIGQGFVTTYIDPNENSISKTC